MNVSEAVKRKCSTQLRERLSASNSALLDVIVRVKDAEALSRPNLIVELDQRVEQEQQHAVDTLSVFVDQLELDNDEIRVVDTSWLSHSLLISGKADRIAKLAELEQVESLELNSEFTLRQ